MAIVIKIIIKIKSKIKSCAEFVEAFVDRMLDESFGHNEVRVIFDRYVKGSLKAQTRVGRTEGYSTVYRVHDETKTDNLDIFRNFYRQSKQNNFPEQESR